ncbi:DUF1433 domain-containing protein [Vagococcus entomophilus]|nr:DUF1433 domain-containing protein [Vagococcus entomophilus]
MTKKNKVILITFFSIILCIGGFIRVRIEQQKDSEQKIANFWETQKPRVEKFIKYNFKNINSITYTNIEKTPFSTVQNGYINNDKNLYFDVSVSIGTGEKEFESNISHSGNLDSYVKYPEFIPVSQIDNRKKK